MNLRFQPTTVEDFGVLVDLRIDAMRESLEAIGRFDRNRSIERFRSSFAPEKTKKIIAKRFEKDIDYFKYSF